MTPAGASPLDLARRLVEAAPPGGVVALTGAGISTDAGIPDFRGPKGLWTLTPGAERLSRLEVYLSDAEARRAGWRSRLTSPVFSAEPTAGHRALQALALAGRLSTIVTQNTDGLHQRAGSDPATVVEVHGTALWTECWRCHDRQPTAAVLERVRAGDDDPHCTRTAPGTELVCGGVLKTATISFGQSLDPAVLDRAVQAVAGCAVLVVVGTTLEVQPVAGLVPLARRFGAQVLIVNGSPTALDALATVVVRGPISELLPGLAGTAADC